MDIVREINGRKQTFCLPASQYVAGLIKKDMHEEYDIEVELTGTGASLKKHSKRKYVDYHDREHVSYLKTSKPPVHIGGFYWEGDKDLAVFYKTCTDEENKRLRNERILLIPYDVYRHLRDEDLIEITGIDIDKTGKEIKVKFKAAKGFIKNHGQAEETLDDMPWYAISKDKFSRIIVKETLKNRKLKPRRGRG